MKHLHDAKKALSLENQRRALVEKTSANYIGTSRSFLRQDRMNGIQHNRTPGPRYVRIGRRIRYLIDDLDQWLTDHIVEREVPGHE